MRHRQGGACDARLRCGVRDLTDLAFERGNRRCVDQRRPLAVGAGLVVGQVCGAQPIAVERAAQFLRDLSAG